MTAPSRPNGALVVLPFLDGPRAESDAEWRATMDEEIEAEIQALAAVPHLESAVAAVKELSDPVDRKFAHEFQASTVATFAGGMDALKMWVLALCRMYSVTGREPTTNPPSGIAETVAGGGVWISTAPSAAPGDPAGEGRMRVGPQSASSPWPTTP